MKGFKKIWSILLVCIMVLSLAACNDSAKDSSSDSRERTRRQEREEREEKEESKESEEKESDESKSSDESEKKDSKESESKEDQSRADSGNFGLSDQGLIGTYVAVVPIRDFAQDDSFDEMEEMGMVNLLGTTMKFELVLQNEKDFTIGVDIDTLKKDMSDRLRLDADTLMKKMFAESGVTPDKYDTVAQAAGYADYNAMKDEMVKQFEEEFEKSLSSEMNAFEMKGTYEVSGSEIVFESSEKAQIQADGSIKMNLESDGISLDLVFKK